MSKYLSLMLTYLILIISFTSHYIQLFFPLSFFFYNYRIYSMYGQAV